jgi:BMFP domain-containing protein YqiC
MQKDNKFFEDVAKMASGAAGNLLEMKREMEAALMARFEKTMQNMNLASKDECEALRATVAQLRLEQEALKARLDALEAQKSAN